MIDGCRIEGAQDGPSAVDVIHAPAAVPASIGKLCAAQIIEGACCRRISRWHVAELRQHREATRGDILRGWIKQRAVVGKRNVVEIILVVIGIEGAPGAVLALHAYNPLA